MLNTEATYGANGAKIAEILMGPRGRLAGLPHSCCRQLSGRGKLGYNLLLSVPVVVGGSPIFQEVADTVTSTTHD